MNYINVQIQENDVDSPSINVRNIDFMFDFECLRTTETFGGIRRDKIENFENLDKCNVKEDSDDFLGLEVYAEDERFNNEIYASAKKCKNLSEEEENLVDSELKNENWPICEKLDDRSIKITGVYELRDKHLENIDCTKDVTRLIIGEGIIFVSAKISNVFKDLVEVQLPSTMRVVGDMAFENCANLVTVKLGGAKEIGYRSFSDCKNLENIDLENVAHISEKAFCNCTKLRKINLNGTCSKLAFQNCLGLSEVCLGEDIVIEDMESTFLIGNSASYIKGKPVTIKIIAPVWLCVSIERMIREEGNRTNRFRDFAVKYFGSSRDRNLLVAKLFNEQDDEKKYSLYYELSNVDSSVLNIEEFIEKEKYIRDGWFVNKLLREESENKLVSKIILSMDKLIDKNTCLPCSITLYRGVKNLFLSSCLSKYGMEYRVTSENITNRESQRMVSKLIGKIWTDRSYISTSMNRHGYGNLGADNYGNNMMYITVPKGLKAVAIGSHASQGEIVLPRNTMFIINNIKIKQDRKGYIIFATVLAPEEKYL